jgi:hypothetical protein
VEQSPITQRSLEAGRLNFEVLEASLKTTQDHFVGLFLIQCHIGDYAQWFTTEIIREPPMLKMLLDNPSTPYAMWLPELQRTVHLGIVYVQSDENSMYWMYGYLKKRGSRWRWQPMNSDELVALGLPADCKGRII